MSLLYKTACISASKTSYFISLLLTITVAIGFALFSPACRHWFLFPLILCGSIIGFDGVRYFRGKLNLFDPAVIISIIGYHFFFLAPVLHVHWDRWLPYVEPPSDWRLWLGNMAILNLVCIIIYKYSCRFTFLRIGRNKPAHLYLVSPKRLRNALLILLPIALLLQTYVYARYGGVYGYISAYSERHEFAAFVNMGIVFSISESFPILLAIGYVSRLSRLCRAPSWIVLCGFMLVFFLMQMYFGGLRGSRSSTIWKLFWLAGMIHLAVKPMPKKLLALGVCFILLFMYTYAFFKHAGTGFVELMREDRISVEERSGRDFQVNILVDLARSEIQAYLLHHAVTKAGVSDIAYGRTYLGALSILVPRWIWPDRPPHKVKEGTDALYGRGAWSEGLSSSRVYGLGGEAMLNYGVMGPLCLYALFGVFVAYVRHRIYFSIPGCAMVMMAPFLVNIAVIMLVGDSDNLLFFAIKNGLLPYLLLLYSSTKLNTLQLYTAK